MINYKMVLQYDGSRYSGWQVQGNTEQTIQGKLQSVLEKMTEEEIEIHGSGRTDAGVHAMGQVANFKLQREYEPEEIKRYCNQYLPEDIVVLEVSEVPVSQQIKCSKKDLLLSYFLRREAGCIPEKICNTGGRIIGYYKNEGSGRRTAWNS